MGVLPCGATDLPKSSIVGENCTRTAAAGHVWPVLYLVTGQVDGVQIKPVACEVVMFSETL